MDTWTVIYITVVGQVLLAGLVSIVFTIPKVEPHWKGAYWMGLGASACFAGALALVVIRRVTPDFLPPRTIIYVLETAIFIVSLLFILVPYLHRLEAKKKNGADR